MNRHWLKRTGWAAVAFVVAALVGYALAAIAATQFVLAEIVGLGLPVSLATRIKTTLQDLLGMTGLYLPILAAGFLVAFVVTAILVRWLPRPRTALYTLAGAVAVMAANLILKSVFDITPIAGARGIWGLAAQGVAGAAAGYTFAIVSRLPASGRT